MQHCGALCKEETLHSELKDQQPPNSEEKEKYRMSQLHIHMYDNKNKTFLDNSYQSTHGDRHLEKSWRKGEFLDIHSHMIWKQARGFPDSFNQCTLTILYFLLFSRLPILNFKELCSNFHFLFHLSAMGISLSPGYCSHRWQLIYVKELELKCHQSKSVSL